MKLPALPSTVAAGRAPGWDLGRLAHRACPACGGDAPEPVCVRPDELRVSRCGRCGLSYLADMPDDEELARFYRRYAVEYKHYAARRASRWSTALDAWRDPRIRILEDTGGLRGRALAELGCSGGTFLERARSRGARVFGVELDEGARKQLDANAIENAAELPGGRAFDVVCAFQVLEHLRDPGALLARVRAALPPDGRALVEVPNGGEIDVVGPTWIGFRVDLEHVNYFSVKTLSSLLARHGLYVEQFWTSAQPGLFRPVERPLEGRLRRLGERLARKAFAAARLTQLGSFVLTVLARPA